MTDAEEKMLGLVRRHFKKLCVIINSGSVMDVCGIQKFNPDALMFVWQGGQETGNGVADVLLGKASPSGKLTDTVARLEDYPSYNNFGNGPFNCYAEDIFVGYRYFNTFAADKIIYPFGFGLTYARFDISDIFAEQKGEVCVRLSFSVKNTGNRRGKQVVQAYISAPQGKLGKAARELAAYVKTEELSPHKRFL